MALTSVLGCAELPTAGGDDGITAPAPPAFEMADVARRLPAASVNAHIYGSFRVNATGGAAGGVLLDGAANFPGHPAAGPGTCSDGEWINANGKPTAGSLMKPHPHCLATTSSIEVVLEPISACYNIFPSVADCPGYAPGIGFFRSWLVFGVDITDDPLKPILVPFGLDGQQDFEVKLGTTGARTVSFGLAPKGDAVTITGYAVDASTLSTTNRRVGTLSIHLAQFLSSDTNYLPNGKTGSCTLDATLDALCLPVVVTAIYQPLPAPDGVGLPDTVVDGFLWLAPATAPYNY